MKTWYRANRMSPSELVEFPYVAYGSNLWKEGMKHRCPDAQPLGKGTVNGVLVFRSVADVVKSDNRDHRCPVGLWSVTATDIEALDGYEGFPYLYRRVIVPVRVAPRQFITGFMYVMTRTDIHPPAAGYYDIIRRGYEDFKMDPEPLYAALKHSREIEENGGASGFRPFTNVGRPPLRPRKRA